MTLRNIISMAITALALSAVPARADKLDDFKNAVAAPRPSCRTIPYSDLQSTCSSEGAPMHEYCDAKRGPVTCGSEGISRALINKLEKEKTNYEALKEKKKNLEEKKSQSSDDKEKSALTTEIDATDKLMGDLQGRVAAVLSLF